MPDFVSMHRDARRAPPGSKSWCRHCTGVEFAKQYYANF